MLPQLRTVGRVHALISFVCVALAFVTSPSAIADDLPIVPNGFQVEVVAREPMVSNPCAMAFDRRGRICIGQGPQYRSPTPDTPGDRVDILIDDDHDGIADRRTTFAEGFNCIQGLAWHGRDLWVANAPDLTVVRDTDGDDKADEYIRVYTDLGNLEHALHGLNFGPDGKLYMSKGNSRGYNRPDHYAPQAFRELWGLPTPHGVTADGYPKPSVQSPNEYQRKYHTPADDWGLQGGILRCEPYVVRGGKKQVSGANIEIVARGFRNPWDIAFDDEFNWLGTDNDQSTGDRIFAPFRGAHFGWGHPWSYSWTGKDHLPTVPVSAPTFEGSGTGVIHYHASQFPESFRNVFFVCDWLRREVLAFRPRWDGALMVDDSPTVFAHADGGRTMAKSDGRAFDPTDIEVGPDGCLYVLSWGHEYGATVKDGKQTNVGRVYRISHKDNEFTQWNFQHRAGPLAEWTLAQLFTALGCSVPAWRTNAQSELTRRRSTSVEFLLNKLQNPNALTKSQQTWTIWTLARLDRLPVNVRDDASLNVRIQTLRALASSQVKLPEKLLVDSLASSEPRLRFEAAQAIHNAGLASFAPLLEKLMHSEKDRLTFYAAWNAFRKLIPASTRREKLREAKDGTRLGLLLGLLADDALTTADVKRLQSDSDERVASIAEDWLVKTGGAKPLVSLDPPPGDYAGSCHVIVKTSLRGHRIAYTLDGSIPTKTSPTYQAPILIDSTKTITVALLKDQNLTGRILKGTYTIRSAPQYAGRRFVSNVSTPSGRHYEMHYRGLEQGKRIYTDRRYSLTSVPAELVHAPFLRVANNDDRSSGERWLTFQTDVDTNILVGTDTRNTAPLSWMRIGQPGGFTDTGLVVHTDDANFRMYRKAFPAGEVVLGGNTNTPRDSGRGNYIVVFERRLLTAPKEPVIQTQVVSAMETADPIRGREYFMHPRGAGCIKCHAMEGVGRNLAPDLSDLGNRARTPATIVESILHPGRVITEGFAQQQILTEDGKSLAGAIIEETARTLKVVSTEGVVTVVNKKDIDERISTKLSPMPSGFDKMMTAQQIADIVAWLMNQKVTGDRSGFSFRIQPDHIDIHFGQQRIATYLTRHPKLTRRALVNVTTPGGIQVTRNFPPRSPEDIDPGYRGKTGIIHPHMHAGLWMGFGDVAGNDYWRLKANVLFDGFVDPPKGDKTTATFAARNRFMSTDGKRVVCNEITRYRFERTPNGLLLRLDAEYKSDDADFYFGDQEESGLAIRVASPIRVRGGNGTILNDRGERNEPEIWGKRAQWFDYFGTIDDRQVGVMVMPDPNNPRPSWLHARDYGVIVTNPFPKQPKERREPYIKTWVKRGERFRLSYAVLIHDLPAEATFDRERAVQKLLQSLK